MNAMRWRSDWSICRTICVWLVMRWWVIAKVFSKHLELIIPLNCSGAQRKPRSCISRRVESTRNRCS